jgi:SAM-dependent methyltransferase
MAKRPFVRKQKRKKHGATFWDNEYASGDHLKLSEDASDDLEKFTRWLERRTKRELLNPTGSVLDLGCGNGRNLLYLAETFGMHGIGYDISTAAIKQAKALSDNYQIMYEARSIAGDIPLPDASQTFVLDMMSSHFLDKNERTHLRDEAFRVLKPGGWLFMKTFLRDGDLHSERLLKEFPTKEEGTYTHPVMGMPEHVYFENELIEFLEEKFTVHKVYRSHKHISRGKARKRRTIAVYAEKPAF